MNAPPSGHAPWLDRSTPPGTCLTPEAVNRTHQLIRRTTEEFVAAEVLPAESALAAKDWARARSLLRNAGELGLIGTDVPEEWGGSDLGVAASALVAEVMGASPSFAVTFGGQAGIALLPIRIFGSYDQRSRYIPRLLSADLVGAYALSEAGAGTDAFQARTSARRAADGSWVLDGEKLWVTNGGFADLFITFARTTNDDLGAFIVERDFPGVRTGAEEHKLGLDGTSTTPLVLTSVRVPAENLLGDPTSGRRIALTTLGFGRVKLAATCLGTAKISIREACRYAETRRQFGRPLARFGAISAKLASMAAGAYAVESALYRTAGLIDDDARAGAGGADDRLRLALDRFGVESSILKVAASEMLDGVVDELVQIHGGNGYVRGHGPERRYRDARVNRIFEGTNEIHRVSLPAAYAKGARREQRPAENLDVLRERILGAADRERTPSASIASLSAVVAVMKDAAAVALAGAEAVSGLRMADEQEFQLLASDVLIETYLADSVVLRADRAASTGIFGSAHEDAAIVFVYGAAERASAALRRMMAAAGNRMGDDGLRQAAARALDPGPWNVIEAGRRLAAEVSRAGGYPFI